MKTRTYEQRAIEGLQPVLGELLSITDGCRIDMHEPEEQEVSARVIGNTLDNAFGTHVEPWQVAQGCQELIVYITKDQATAAFNLADLIALARMARL